MHRFLCVRLRFKIRETFYLYVRYLKNRCVCESVCAHNTADFSSGSIQFTCKYLPKQQVHNLLICGVGLYSFCFHFGVVEKFTHN